MSFLPTQTILQDVNDILKSADVGKLPPYWSGVVAQSQAWAYQTIVSELTGRGFTLAQILAWDRGAEFERSLAMFWALTRGGVGGKFEDGYIKSLDRRKELTFITIVDNGVPFTPGDTTLGLGLIGTGAYDGSQDLFGTPIDPNDPNLGQVVKW